MVKRTQRLVVSLLMTTFLGVVLFQNMAHADTDWYGSDNPPVYRSGLIDNDGNVVTPTEHYDSAGASLQIGGGVSSFTAPDTLSATGVGGYWDARLVLGVRSPIGLEMGYVGTAYDINAFGLDSTALLVGHGAEAALRINIPVVNGETLVAPFFFGGIGWNHYNIVNTQFRNGNAHAQEDVMTWPVGAGMVFAYRHFLFDARFTYRFSEGSELIRTGMGDAMSLNHWTAGAHIGYLF